ncbi:MAG TPA: hypothetical protein VFW11_17235 [Cyclobacteriaceae bacterium]|nr:hypothetical protein [Cyclobacteriaceae bacterium]
MIEASPTKFYFAKYFFLAFSLLQWIMALTFFFRFNESNKHIFGALVFISIGLVFFYIFLLVNDKVKRVAIGKNKIVIMDGHRNLRFEWPEVKSLKIVPFFNLYKLRLKGRKESIFFFPSKTIDPAFGLLTKDTSKMGEIVQKKKKDHNIK